jgi:hypothetical protein
MTAQGMYSIVAGGFPKEFYELRLAVLKGGFFVQVVTPLGYTVGSIRTCTK